MSDSDLQPVSVERDGRILTGTAGVSADQLADTMSRFDAAESDDAPAPVEASPTPPAAPHPEKRTRGQARYAELRAKSEAAEKDAADWKQKYESLERQRQTAQPAPVSTPAPAQHTVSRPADPAPSARSAKIDYPESLKTFETFLTANPGLDPSSAYDAWRDAREDHRDAIRQAQYDARIRDGIDADRINQARHGTANALVERGRKAYPDFDAARNAVAHIQFPQVLLDRIINLDGGEHVVYQLAKNPELAARLASSRDGLEVGLALAKLVPAAAGVGPASPAPTGLSSAPPPYQPVGGGSKTTIPSSGQLVKGFDFDASGYREKRKAERGGRR
jgi:hypothetical protein